MKKYFGDYITYAEATKSATAIRLGIVNVPDSKQEEAMSLVAECIFDKIKEEFPTRIAVSSFFRSTKLNKAIKGSINSQHTKGEAIDIDGDIFGNVTNTEIFNYIKRNLEFDQLIWEFGNKAKPDWVHVSYKRKGNRKMILTEFR